MEHLLNSPPNERIQLIRLSFTEPKVVFMRCESYLGLTAHVKYKIISAPAFTWIRQLWCFFTQRIFYTNVVNYQRYIVIVVLNTHILQKIQW